VRYLKQQPAKLILNQQQMKQLQLPVNTKLQVDFIGNSPTGVVIHPLHFLKENTSWFGLLLPSLISVIIFTGYFIHKKVQQIPLSGYDSLANWTIILGTISGSLLFSCFYFKNRAQIQQWFGKKMYWRSLPTIIASFVIILAIGLLAFFWILETIFKGLSFDLWTATFIFSLFSIIINFLMFYAVANLSADAIFKLLITVIISGALAAMITNSNKHWWTYNISFLGTAKASNSWQFNLTLIVAALLFLALVDFLFSSLQTQFPKNKRLLILRLLLTIFSLSLGAVGIFANNAGVWHRLHTDAATTMIRVLIIIILTVNFLLPDSPRQFKQLSYATAGILIFSSLLFQPIGYLSLTAFELIAFMLTFAWLLLLLQHLQTLAGKNVNHLKLEIIVTTDKKDSV
jgi:hypothetical membrane protein